ncbi:MAG: crossover junction endodeoxyribonuclease RuvC [Rickettsiaceae bacterium]|nr:crossover junction endodeoxyribonuclease RuvC [Rickettsiaceae bacterium]MDP4832184.1 crossover junction endodeoxyribonuclease RuvC [Rickettsiaceae bacterium]MDP5020434.1 crossover junction endodeoxyribonuclease RuvC [Rickettsiaceae bacterium]MDP5083069.1 crossover junction endodeoxyribonuclease RuvC [Rickettsiaceae bacterium]
MKILGIDPALSCLGWGIIQLDSPKINYIDSGIIKTKADTALHLRLSNITGVIEQIIDLHKPQAIAMEETFININAGSSLKLGYVRGALMAIIGKTQLPFYEYAPNKIKKTIVGTGHAQKEQVKHMINMIISGSTNHICFDEADALAVAYTCLAHHRAL